MRTIWKPPDPDRHDAGSRAMIVAVMLVLAMGSAALLVAGRIGKAAPGGSSAPAVSATAQVNGAAATETAVSAVAAPATASAPYDWFQFDGDPQHSGNNTLESAISPQNVAGLKQLFQVTLPAIADGAPVYSSGVSAASGVRDLLFVTTKSGDIVALDAHTGSQVWVQHNPAGTCTINNEFQPCYTTSSPVVDPNHQYVYSYGLDGRVHKYRVSDGAEVTGGGWPETATIKGFNEKGSSALSFATDRSGATYLYVANGGYLGDRGDYQGHVTAINLANGSQNVFNANCSNQTVHLGLAPNTPSCGAVQSAIWARPGVVYDPGTDRIYMATGNGPFDPGQNDWGDTVFALRPDGTGSNGGPLDSYTPTNHQQLDDQDLDLGSTAPAILPVPANSGIQHLAVQGGKDAMLRLLNLDDLSGQGGTGNIGGELSTIRVPQGGQVLTQPAVWVDPNDNTSWVFVATARGISGLELSVAGSGVPSLQTVWKNRTGGTSPIVANGVLYYASSSNIQALNPVDGTRLWSNRGIGDIHWESPIVANGVLYVTDESRRLTAFALP